MIDKELVKASEKLAEKLTKNQLVVDEPKDDDYTKVETDEYTYEECIRNGDEKLVKEFEEDNGK